MDKSSFLIFHDFRNSFSCPSSRILHLTTLYKCLTCVNLALGRFFFMMIIMINQSNHFFMVVTKNISLFIGCQVLSDKVLIRKQMATSHSYPFCVFLFGRGES